MKKLIELIKEFDLNQTDKHIGHAYIEHFYQQFFEPYRDKELNVLEIGSLKSTESIITIRRSLKMFCQKELQLPLGMHILKRWQTHCLLLILLLMMVHIP